QRSAKFTISLANTRTILRTRRPAAPDRLTRAALRSTFRDSIGAQRPLGRELRPAPVASATSSQTYLAGAPNANHRGLNPSAAPTLRCLCRSLSKKRSPVSLLTSP